MSSYLSFYLQFKPKEESKINNICANLFSFSRNSNIYQLFTEEYNIGFGFENKTEITKEMLETLISEKKSQIIEEQEKLNVYKDSKGINEEAINLSIECIKDYKEQLNILRFLSTIVEDFIYSDFNKLYTVID